MPFQRQATQSEIAESLFATGIPSVDNYTLLEAATDTLVGGNPLIFDKYPTWLGGMFDTSKTQSLVIQFRPTAPAPLGEHTMRMTVQWLSPAGVVVGQDSISFYNYPANFVFPARAPLCQVIFYNLTSPAITITYDISIYESLRKSEYPMVSQPGIEALAAFSLLGSAESLEVTRFVGAIGTNTPLMRIPVRAGGAARMFLRGQTNLAGSMSMQDLASGDFLWTKDFGAGFIYTEYVSISMPLRPTVLTTDNVTLVNFRGAIIYER